ncbi:ATP-binding protein [Nonomuraea sp. NPDC003754]
MLRGRDQDERAIGDLVDGARAGRSGALVVRGDPGIGKTALLDSAARAAEGCGILRCTGVETETELPFAALHQVLLPGLARVDGLPDAQADALKGALGRRDR